MLIRRFAVLALAALMSACGPLAGLGGNINFGGTYNLTGDLAALDVPASRGSELAVKQINAAGGVLGRKINFIVLDGRTDPSTIGKTARELTDADKVVAVVGNSDTDSALIVGAIAQSAGIPYLTEGATSPKLPAQVGNDMFLEPFGDNVQAAAGAEFMYNTLGCKTSWRLWDTSAEYTRLLAQYWQESYEQLGGKVLLDDNFAQGETDFSAQIARLKALDPQPDCLYVAALTATDAGVIAKQLRGAGIDSPMVGGDGYDAPELLSVGGAAADNVYFTTHAFLNAAQGSEKMKSFIAAYHQEYGTDPQSAFAALGYDAIYLLVDAMRRAGSTDPNAIRQALAATTDFAGVTGTVTYESGSRVPQKTVTIIAVKNAAYTLADQMTPTHVPSP
jgi:branched-chain amino acid transport system substrate-binding protein